MLSHLDMAEALRHYRQRKGIHQELTRALNSNEVERYVQLALGISDRAGNYSASEYRTGPSILQANGSQVVFDLAKRMTILASPARVPDLITNSRISYLKISIGSEMSMMLQPNRFWTANKRTVWSSLLVKYGDDYAAAEQELKLYEESNRDSDMDYSLWAAMHPTLEIPLSRLYHLGIDEAKRQNTVHGKLKYLWADTIADMLYYLRSARKP